VPPLGIEGRRVLLTVGGMAGAERYKDHDRVIAGIPDLVRRGHDIMYVIIGRGNGRARLDQLALKAAVGEHVRFLGAVEAQHLAKGYRTAALFVMPSTGEGFPRCGKVGAAMARVPRCQTGSS
jgi:phosphatidylinositol alpha-1,6-mannosyltransferase